MLKLCNDSSACFLHVAFILDFKRALKEPPDMYGHVAFFISFFSGWEWGGVFLVDKGLCLERWVWRGVESEGRIILDPCNLTLCNLKLSNDVLC